MDNWKRYPEDVPKKKGYYLRFGNIKNDTTFSFYDGENWQRRMGDKNNQNVTFWMELPKAPKNYGDYPESLRGWPFWGYDGILSLLKEKGIDTINKLLKCTESDLLAIKGIGVSKLREINNCIALFKEIK